MIKCKHEYFRTTDLGAECMRCGLLKSTIESGESAEYKNKAARPKDLVITAPDSLDSLLEEFEEKFSESELCFGIGRTKRNKLLDFICRTYEAGREEGMELRKSYTDITEELLEKARQEEQTRIIKIIDGMKRIDNIGDALYNSMSVAWNQALESLKKRIEE